jgi:hypothetical protein
MRTLLGLVLVGSLSLVACGSEDDTRALRHNPAALAPPAAPAPQSASATAPPAAPTCPATVPAATAISTTDTSAQDIHLIPGFVVYRNDLKVVKVDPTGKRTEFYASKDLVHAFSDQDVLVTIESPNPPDAVLKVMPVGDTKKAITVTPDNWSAGGTTVFASDTTSFYVLADVATQGDTIYKVSKTDPNQRTVLANLEGAPLGDPQLAGTDVWFVREQKRVYKVTQADPAAPADPTEIFGIGYANCNLAVGGSHAFCSTGKALEQRDLTGANMQTIFDGQTGASPSLLGTAIFGSDTVFVRSLPATQTDALKNGIRAINGTDDKLVACGREPINAFTADDKSVVWAEQGKGVFSAPR